MSKTTLDEILAKHNGELGVTREDPDVVTPDTKQAILDWHNKQIEKLLSNPQPTYARSLKNLGEFLERYNLDIGLAEDKENLKKWSDAIEAERNKLNNSDGDVK